MRLGLIIGLDLASVLLPVDAHFQGLSLESPLGVEGVVFGGHPGSLDCFDRRRNGRIVGSGAAVCDAGREGE